MALKYNEAMFFCTQANVLRAHAEIVSGAYKQVDVSHYDGTPFSEEEKLKRKVDEMNRHIHFMRDIAENLET